MKWPPAVWEVLRERIPEQERSAFIRSAVAEALAREAVALPSEERKRRVRAGRGALAGSGGSADEFCGEKQREIDREEAAHRRRWEGAA